MAVETVDLIFFSQLTEEVTFGKNKTVRPVLKRHFCKVQTGQNGWFGARFTGPRDRAVAIFHRVQAQIPDLVVEKVEEQAPAAAAAAAGL